MRNQSDRGAALVQVAMGLLAMIAFSTFVMDYGVFWTGRRQAQNAADAAAHAGAVALAFDNQSDYSATGAASESALLESQRNLIWGQSPSVVAATDITFPTTPSQCASGSNRYCVRVDVYRTAARGNALPIFFGRIVNLTSQDVRATATAMVQTANSSNCMKPWAVPDLFTDANGDGTYDAGDTYIAPTDSTLGTGYSVTNNYGQEVSLKTGPGGQLGPGWFQATDIGGNGASGYRSAIAGCTGTSYGIGDILPPKNGNMAGPTRQGVSDVVGEDPNAYWDPTANNGKGAIAGSCAPTCATQSPRIVAVPIFDPAYYASTGDIKIVNIYGFFIESNTQNGFDVTGILVNVPALFDGGKGSVGSGSAFLVSISMIR